MRVIVIGAGEVGRHVASTLSAERHDVTMVDRDEALVERLQEDLDALVVAGNGASPRVLREVSAHEADLVCALTESDEVNLIAAMSAKQLGAARTVARVRGDDYYEGQASSAQGVLGIDVIIQPERVTASDLAESILVPGAVHVEYFADGRVGAAEVIVSDRSPLLGKPMGERRIVRPNFIFGLIRDGKAIAAEPYHKVKVNDHVLVAAAREDLAPTVAHLAGHVERVRDVVVFGAGRVGLPLARRLERAERLRVLAMEPDPERARYAAERLDRATVVVEEGVSKDMLVAHGVDQAGAFAACSFDDRTNLLAALHAKQLGAGLCLAVVSSEAYTPLVDELGIDAAFSPRLVTAEAILRSVRGENVRSMYLLIGGAEVLEIQADPGCRAEGRPIVDTDRSARAHVAAIVRDGAVVMPHEDERVRAGDAVVVFNLRHSGEDLQRMFKAA